MKKTHFIIAFISIFIVFILAGIIYREVNLSTHGRKYLYVTNTINYKLNGIIEDKRTYHDDIVGLYIKISSDSLRMYQIYDVSSKRNHTYPVNANLIKKGDSIFKEKDSETVSIYRADTLVVRFVIGE